MFRGANKITLDAKGRVSIPVRYRDRIAGLCDGLLVCTVDQDRCLLLYPMPEWEEIERKLMRLSSFQPKVRRLQRLMVGYASEMEMDGHGRVLIPRELREFAGLERAAILFGQGNKFELWDEAQWQVRQDQWLSAAEEDGLGLPADLESLSL